MNATQEVKPVTPREGEYVRNCGGRTHVHQVIAPNIVEVVTVGMDLTIVRVERLFTGELSAVALAS